jgi:hypothetical protein
MTLPIASFQRRFQIWLYTVSHSQLLLRSNRSDQYATRIDLLFKDVGVMHLPASFNGLVVMEASEGEARNLNIQLGAQQIHGQKVFVIQGSNFEGYVVAGAVFWHEDEGHYFDESYFQKSF